MISYPKSIKIVKKTENHGIFEIGPFYPGYGITIGNSLRRVLLSSLEGAAITRAKIKGISHEFSAIPGVMEDVLVLVLNLKQIRFKMFSDEPEKALLKVKGEREARAKDIETSPNLEIINKDALIATLTEKKAELEMELTIERGLGYEPAERLEKNKKLEIGEIVLDAVFSPVTRVIFKTENIRVGDRTDFDKLILEIETDGTIDPDGALYKSAAILKKHFDFVESNLEPKGEKKEKKEKGGEKEEEKDEIGKIKIQELGLSQRVINALEKNKIKTVSGLIKKKEKDLLEMEGLGEQAVGEIKKKLKKIDLEFSPILSGTPPSKIKKAARKQ
ncbi:MAG: DNA-directed RNA polymerase subunit alpha [bacterium]|nr:DNA-directed RNA polymerase subunit alpha [bacterium]